MQKRLALLCIAILFVSALVVAMHHHEDGLSHNTCPICRTANLAFASANNVPEVHPTWVKFSFSSEISFVLPKAASAPTDSRAPPA
jgi:hypothetical protein